LELVAKIRGSHDWNVLSASIQQRRSCDCGVSGSPAVHRGWRWSAYSAGAGYRAFPSNDHPTVARDTSKRAVEHAMAVDKRILAIAQKRAADDNLRP
jgi:uncharacterized protein